MFLRRVLKQRLRSNGGSCAGRTVRIGAARRQYHHRLRPGLGGARSTACCKRSDKGQDDRQGRNDHDAGLRTSGLPPNCCLNRRTSLPRVDQQAT